MPIKKNLYAEKIGIAIEQVSISGLETLKNRPRHGDLGEVGKNQFRPKENCTSPNAATERAKLFSAKAQEVEIDKNFLVARQFEP